MSSVTVDKTWLFVDDRSHLVTSEITRITLLSSLKIKSVSNMKFVSFVQSINLQRYLSNNKETQKRTAHQICMYNIKFQWYEIGIHISEGGVKK